MCEQKNKQTSWPLWRTKQCMDSYRRTWLVTIS